MRWRVRESWANGREDERETRGVWEGRRVSGPGGALTLLQTHDPTLHAVSELALAVFQPEAFHGTEVDFANELHLCPVDELPCLSL